MRYSPEDLITINLETHLMLDRVEKLERDFLREDFVTDRAKTMCKHGFMRRSHNIRHCFNRVYEHVPLTEKRPSQQAIDDAGIYLQAFIFNLFGALDNLAWIWFYETRPRSVKGQLLRAPQIGLGPTYEGFRAGLPPQTLSILQQFDEWFGYLINYRHALAHRIPLYIPPAALYPEDERAWRVKDEEAWKALLSDDVDRHDRLRAEQSLLGEFPGLMMHSFGPDPEDGRPVQFHAQMIADINTLEQIGRAMLDAFGLERLSSTSCI